MTSVSLSDVRPRTSLLSQSAVPSRQLAAFLVGVIVAVVSMVLPHLFVILACAAFCVAAFTVSPTVGFTVLGVVLLFLNAHLVADGRARGRNEAR